MSEDLHPYIVFLPSEKKLRMLTAIFGSRAAVDVLRFSLAQGISKKIYQKDLIGKLAYSNKTVIGNLKALTKLGVLTESMEKLEQGGHTAWVKAYQLSDSGRWFALLLAEEKDLSDGVKAEILQNAFRTYVRWVRNLSERLHMDKKLLKETFLEEMQ
jgi:DNA-binding PadR family transcriptional regulator